MPDQASRPKVFPGPFVAYKKAKETTPTSPKPRAVLTDVTGKELFNYVTGEEDVQGTGWEKIAEGDIGSRFILNLAQPEYMRSDRQLGRIGNRGVRLVNQVTSAMFAVDNFDKAHLALLSGHTLAATAAVTGVQGYSTLKHDLPRVRPQFQCAILYPVPTDADVKFVAVSFFPLAEATSPVVIPGSRGYQEYEVMVEAVLHGSGGLGETHWGDTDPVTP